MNGEKKGSNPARGANALEVALDLRRVEGLTGIPARCYARFTERAQERLRCSSSAVGDSIRQVEW